MSVTRAHGLAVVLTGVGLIVLAMIGSRLALDARRDDERDVAELRARLDSVRAALARASAADSSRLTTEVQEREYFLGRREYHLAHPAPGGSPWRRPFGPGTVVFGAGLVIIVLGGGILSRVAPRAT